MSPLAVAALTGAAVFLVALACEGVGGRMRRRYLGDQRFPPRQDPGSW